MTTDQICLAISTFAAVVFAFMYYKAMADSKHFKLENQQQRNNDLLWREMDNMANRLDRVEHRCNCCPQMSMPCAVNNQGSVSF